MLSQNSTSPLNGTCQEMSTMPLYTLRWQVVIRKTGSTVFVLQYPYFTSIYQSCIMINKLFNSMRCFHVSYNLAAISCSFSINCFSSVGVDFVHASGRWTLTAFLSANEMQRTEILTSDFNFQKLTLISW